MSTNYDERESGFGLEREYERAGMGGRGPRRMQRRGRSAGFCMDKVDLIDFKDVSSCSPTFRNEERFLPRRISGICATHQRMLAEAIKRARNIALLPYAAD